MSNKIEKARKYFNIMKSGIERGLNKLKVDGTDFVEIAETLFAEIDRLTAENSALTKQLKNARNELCLKCSRYHEAHNGACDGCKWKEVY